MLVLQLNMILDKKNYILMLNVRFLSKSLKVAFNSSKNVSKLLSKGDWCSNKGANQTMVVLDNKIPMNLTWAKLVGYWWGWSWMIKCTWLTKPQNFEHMPSNLLGRLICGSFGCCKNTSQRGRSLIGLQMSNKFMKCLIFEFKIHKDNKNFYGCKHDLKTKG